MIGEMFRALSWWQMFAIAVVVFGFAPGAVLRLIVKAFPRDDPRRSELLAELHAVPRIERPFWVFEQLEVALNEGLIKRLLARHAQADPPVVSAIHRARPLVLAARRHFRLGQFEKAGQVAAAALALASEVGDNWSIGWALHVQGIVTGNQKQAVDALPFFERALAVSQDDPELTDLRPLVLVNKAVMLGDLDQYENALAAAREAQQLADQAGLVDRQAQAHNTFGQLLFATGQWDEAIAEVEAVAEDNKDPATVCCDYGIAAIIYFHRGEARTACKYLAAAAPYAEQVGNRVIASLALGRCLAAEHSGAPTEALAALTAGYTNNTEETEETGDLFTDAVRLALKVGNLSAALTLAGRAEALARDTEILHQRANALHCRGLLDQDPAALFQAAGYFRDSRRPLLRAQALEAAVSVLIDKGDASSAQTAVALAMEVYVSLDATNDVARLRNLGALQRHLG